MALKLNELALLAGVSTATVSRVVNGKDAGRVRGDLRQRILTLAERHGYRVNPAARALSQGRTSRLALCFEGAMAPDSLHTAVRIYDRLNAFTRAIQAAGYTSEILHLDVTQPIAELGHSLSRRAVDGVIFLSWFDRRVENLIFSLQEKRIPAILSGSPIFGDAFSWTDVDRVDAFEQATRYLLSEGHREIAFLCAGTYEHGELKVRGFLNAMQSERGEDATQRVIRGAYRSLADVFEMTHRALDAFPGVTALLMDGAGFHDGVVQALKLRGREAGRDVRLIGFGEKTLADSSQPRLTHYGNCLEEQVAFSLECLFDAMRDPANHQPRHRVFKSRLALRDT